MRHVTAILLALFIPSLALGAPRFSVSVGGSGAFDIPTFTTTKPTDGQILTRYVVTRAGTIPANFAGSKATTARVAATSSTVMAVKVNGAVKGTITFPAGLAPHRYWRLRMTSWVTGVTCPGGTIYAPETKLFEGLVGGSNVATGGTAIAQSNGCSGTVAPWDGNEGNMWCAYNSPGVDKWFGYDMGVGVTRTIRRVEMTTNANYPWNKTSYPGSSECLPGAVSVEYADAASSGPYSVAWTFTITQPWDAWHFRAGTFQGEVPVFSMATPVTLAPGDIVEIVNQGTADATLADFSITLKVDP